MLRRICPCAFSSERLVSKLSRQSANTQAKTAKGGGSAIAAADLESGERVFLLQHDREEVRLADLYDMDREMDALGHRYYTLERRIIHYQSPHVSTHPASRKAKEAADNLNEAYLEALNTHQTVKSKLSEFKKFLDQPDYADLSSCFTTLKVLSAPEAVVLVCESGTNSPQELIGGSKGMEDAIKVFNEMLDTCHGYLENVDVYLSNIKQRIEALRSLAIMQQILDICKTFETQAATNVDIFATEIRSLLLDVTSSAKLRLT